MKLYRVIHQVRDVFFCETDQCDVYDNSAEWLPYSDDVYDTFDDAMCAMIDAMNGPRYLGDPSVRYHIEEMELSATPAHGLQRTG